VIGSVAQNKRLKVSMVLMFSALTLLFLYMACALPVGRIVFYFICSLFIMPIMLERMPMAAFISFGAVFFVGYLVVPDKAGMLPYLFFFGHYGIAKAMLDGGGVRATVIKLVYFNLGMTLIYFFGGQFLTAQLPAGIAIWLVWLIGNGVFLGYDFLFSKLAGWYYHRVRPGLLGKSGI
jgi:hypothetical protein